MLTTPPQDTRLLRFCRKLAHWNGVATSAIALIVLAGWVLNLALLKSITAEWPSMKPNSALAFLAAGLTLTLAMSISAPGWRRRWAMRTMSGLTGVFGLITLGEYTAGTPSGIDQLMFRETGAPFTPQPGRMSILAAVAFVLLGAALLSLLKRSKGRWTWISQSLALATGFVAFMALCGYLYDPTALQRTAFFTSTSLSTAIALLILSAGIVVARPTDGFMAPIVADSAGGALLRRLLLPAVLLPVLLHWVELIAEQRRLILERFGWMSDSALTVLLVGILVWLVSRAVHLEDTARRTAEAELAQSEERFRKLVETSPVGILVNDIGSIVFANPAACEILGARTAGEAVGKSPEYFLHSDPPGAFGRGVRQVLTEGIMLSHLEQKVVTWDGRNLDLEFSATPVDYHGRRLVQIVVRDVSEHNRAEQALRENLERFELIGRATNDAMWDWDLANDLVWWSEAHFSRYGYARDGARSFEAFAARIHPEDRERVTARFRTVIARNETMWTDEFRIRRADDSYGVVLDRAFGLQDSSGRLVRMVGSMMDVTELKRAEESIGLLAQAVATTNEMICITSSDNRIVFANRAFLTGYGYAMEEIHGCTPDMLAPTLGKKSALQSAIQEGARTTGWSGELINRRKDGTEFPIHLGASPVHDAAGRVVGLIYVASDITERKRAEEALRASERRFRAAFEQAAIGMAILSPHGAFLRVNERLAAITGYTADELRNWSFDDITHPEDVSLSRETLLRLLTGEISSYELEKRYLRKDGAAVWVKLAGSLIRCDDGAPDYLFALVDDITERRSLEEQLRQTQKMEAVGQLAGGVAHDFNNVLTAILGHVTLMRDDPILPSLARESVEEIEKAAQRAANLTRQLLLFSRREIFQPHRFDLNEAVAGLAKMLRRLIGEDVQLQLSLSSLPLFIEADPGMVDQVLLNLAVNARDAMPFGGLLHIAASETSVDLEKTRMEADVPPGRTVCLTVRDTGKGIPPELKSRIFEPFFTTKSAGAGTGLGLATVFGIVRQHRGWVTVESEVDHGSTFRVFLPRVESGDTREEAQRLAVRRGMGERVLLVEDDEAVRLSAQMILENHGYEVKSATDGVNALQIWEQERGCFDLLLTDLVMPGGVSGTQLGRRLREKKPGLKVIYASGYSAVHAGRSLGLEAGETFVPKPYLPSQLCAQVYELLNRTIETV